MKVKKLKEIICSLPEIELEREVAVKIYGLYATEPRVLIEDVYLGFDWSNDIFMLIPKEELMKRGLKFSKLFEEKRR